MRTAFIEQLVEEARSNDRIFLIVGDLGFNVVERFRDSYPDRFLNIGIDEQNMIGVAAGLSMQGYNVFVYSIGNFPTLRCMEQIRYDVAYHNADVKIVSVGAGYAYGSLGASHHATEELGMMRTIPSMVVCSPSDPSEAKAITKTASEYRGPMYIRLGKAGEKQIYPSYDSLQVGDIHVYKESMARNAIFVTGSILDYAVKFINENNVDTAIYSVPFVKPISSVQLENLVKKHDNIITLEEHQQSCGLGSAIVEQISDLYANGALKQYPKVTRIAIPDKFYSVSGNQVYLRQLAGLTLQKEMFL